jgi:PBP1b-binding outer membrane lipoprotein LpoB
LICKERIIFLLLTKAFLRMKKFIAFVALALFISACSQYTCPTYSKKEAPKKAAAEQKI